MSSTTDKRVILVVGANKGVGYEAVKFLSQQLPASTLLLGSRSTDNGLAAIKKMQASNPSHPFSNVHVTAIDVTDKASIAAAVAEVKATYGHLDVLLNNSGISNVAGSFTDKGVFDVNVTGAKDCVEAFLPLLTPGASVLVVSSEVGGRATYAFQPSLQAELLSPSTLQWSRIQQLMDDWLAFARGEKSQEQWPEMPNYPVSKAFITPWVRSFALQHPELKVCIVCPGHCATDLNQHRGVRPASVGGESIAWPVLHGEQAQTGRFYQDGKEMPWVMEPPAEYAEMMKKIWNSKKF